MDASAAAAKTVPHPASESLGRANCLGPDEPDPTFPGVQPVDIAVHDDFANELLFAVFANGGLVGHGSLADLGLDLSAYGITDAQAQIDGWAPPVLTDCPSGALLFQLGDVAASVDFLLDGVDTHAELFASFIAEVAPSIAEGPDGQVLRLDVVDVPFFDVGLTEASGGGSDLTRALLDARLDAGLRDDLKTQLLGLSAEIPVPSLEVSGLLGSLLPGIPAGISFVPNLSEIARLVGFTSLTGGAELLVPTP